MKDVKDGNKVFYAFFLATQIGFTIIIPILLFGFLGLKLGTFFHQRRLFFSAFLGIGTFVAGYSVYKWLIPIIKNK